MTKRRLAFICNPRCAASALVGAALSLALAVGLLGGVAGAATDTRPADVKVTCVQVADTDLLECEVTSSRSLSNDENLQLTVTVPGVGSQTVTTSTSGTSGLRPVWCSAPSGQQQFCYTFSTPETPAAAPDASPVAVGGGQSLAPIVATDNTPLVVTQTDVVAVAGTYPCPSQPSLTCVAQPHGQNVVTIQVQDPGDGATVTIDKDGTSTQHDAAGNHHTQEGVEQTKKWQDAVEETLDEDDLPVIWAANGNDSSDETMDKIRLEQEVYDRGKPYVVCFEEVTYTQTNDDGTTEVITVPPPPCVVVTPK